MHNPAFFVSHFQASIWALNRRRCHAHKPDKKAVLGCCNVREFYWRALDRRYLGTAFFFKWFASTCLSEKAGHGHCRRVVSPADWRPGLWTDTVSHEFWFYNKNWSKTSWVMIYGLWWKTFFTFSFKSMELLSIKFGRCLRLIKIENQQIREQTQN